jgi:DNA-binding transcriptional regulator YbjK
VNKSTESPATSKGQRRRQAIVQGAADILLEQGPGGVSHRAVAQRVGCSLSATTYYFSGLDELLSEAGRVNIARWASRAEAAAEAAEANPVPRTQQGVIEQILSATLPTDEELLGHYLQLVAAGESPPVRRAYRTGRDRLNAAVNRVLRRLDVPWSAEMVIAVVDGACVSALSEGRDVRQTAQDRLEELLGSMRQFPARSLPHMTANLR